MKMLHILVTVLSVLTGGAPQICLATPLTDIPPGQLGVSLTVPSFPLSYHYVDTPQRAWTADLKAIAKEAFDEWDKLSRVDFTETQTDGVSIEFVDESKFNVSNWLAAWYAGEIWINDDIPWYFDPTPTNNGDDIFPGKYDLLSVLKHEIGHVLGITGDWGQSTVWPTPPGPPSWTSEGEVMWGVYETGQMKRVIKPSDVRALHDIGIIPEPGTFALLGIGLAVAKVAKRKSRLS